MIAGSQELTRIVELPEDNLTGGSEGILGHRHVGNVLGPPNSD